MSWLGNFKPASPVQHMKVVNIVWAVFEVLHLYLLRRDSSVLLFYFQVSNLTANSAALQWQAPEDDGGSDLSHYLVEVSVDGGDWTKLGKVDSYSTKFRCSDLKTNSKHVFRVSAVNAVGAGKPLESAPVTPAKPPGGEALYVVIGYVAEQVL